MESIIHKAKNFKEADDWDIEQHVKMSPEERQEVAKKLKERYYGKDCPDIREIHQAASDS